MTKLWSLAALALVMTGHTPIQAQTDLVMPETGAPFWLRMLPKRIPLTPPQQPVGAAPAGQINALYVCQTPQSQRYSLRMQPNGTLTASALAAPADRAPGTYTFDGRQMRVQVPSIGFDQTSRVLEVRLGLLLGFATDTLRCGLISHDKGETLQGYAKCPSINHIVGLSYQTNAFQFYADRSVKWRQWDEMTGISDTFYNEYVGTYLLQGGKIQMAFVLKEKEHYLSGTISGNQMLIDQLEPARGACKAE